MPFEVLRPLGVMLLGVNLLVVELLMWRMLLLLPFMVSPKVMFLVVTEFWCLRCRGGLCKATGETGAERMSCSFSFPMNSSHDVSLALALTVKSSLGLFGSGADFGGRSLNDLVKYIE